MRKVSYRGVLMAPSWPEKIAASQSQRHYTCVGVLYPRIPYGNENAKWGADPCRDCGVLAGELHVFAECEYEACPVCGGGQIGSCGCVIEEFREASEPIEAPRSARGDRILALILASIILLCIVAVLFATRRFL